MSPNRRQRLCSKKSKPGRGLMADGSRRTDSPMAMRRFIRSPPAILTSSRRSTHWRRADSEGIKEFQVPKDSSRAWFVDFRSCSVEAFVPSFGNLCGFYYRGCCCVVCVPVPLTRMKYSERGAQKLSHRTE